MLFPATFVSHTVFRDGMLRAACWNSEKYITFAAAENAPASFRRPMCRREKPRRHVRCRAGTDDGRRRHSPDGNLRTTQTIPF